MWWIALKAEDEQVQGKNSLPRRGVLELGELVCGLGGMDPVPDQLPPMVVASPIYRGTGPLPKCLGGKGSHNGQFEGGQLVQAILTKVVFACQRLWW